MRRRALFRLVPFSFALIILSFLSLTFLTACGSSGSSSLHTGQAPVFTTSPMTTATQDVGYSYQIEAIDPAGGSVTFALTTGPAGAAISGNTVSWTPTGAQSRVSNNFEVTAATASGGTATQSWMVTPGGTITVNWVNNYWAASGPLQVPQPPSAGVNLSAMWTNPDGSITVQKSSWTSPGVFSIANVPGGYYWLQTGTSAFWTSAGTFDAGEDFAGGPEPTTGAINNTQFDSNLSGLDSVPEASVVNFVFAVSGPPQIGLFDGPDSTSLSGPGFGFGSSIDWSQINTAFVTQLVPTPLGSLSNVVLESAVTATGLSLVDGGTNTITETLQPSPQTSIGLSVPGSQWAPLLSGNGVAPSAPTPLASALNITAQMYVTQGLASGTVPLASSPQTTGVGILLAPPLSMVSTQVPNSIDTITCSPMSFILAAPTVGQPAITTDQNFGPLQYGDPFPSGWARTLTLCQEATAAIPIPNSSTTGTATFLIVDKAVVAPSSAPVGPVVLPVQNPTVQGLNIFGGGGAGGIATDATVLSLGWTAPTGTAPFGYTVRVYVLTTAGGTPIYTPTGAAFSTAGTSITLPPLAGGNTYVLAITADADGKSNMETSPFRSALPAGVATVVSVPVTISAGALMPEIHGDRRVVERFSQPQAPQLSQARSRGAH